MKSQLLFWDQGLFSPSDAIKWRYMREEQFPLGGEKEDIIAHHYIPHITLILSRKCRLMTTSPTNLYGNRACARVGSLTFSPRRRVQHCPHFCLERKRRKDEAKLFYLEHGRRKTPPPTERKRLQRKRCCGEYKRKLFPPLFAASCGERKRDSRFPGKKRKRNPKCPFFPLVPLTRTEESLGAGGAVSIRLCVPNDRVRMHPPPFHRNTQALPNWICRIKRESKHYCNNSRCFPNVFPHFRTP